MIPPVDKLVLGRLAFGASAEDSAFIQAKGLNHWVEEQLRAPAGDEPAMLARLAAIRLRIRYGAGEGWPAVDELRPLTTLDKDVAQLWPLTDRKVPLAGPERQLPRREVAAAAIQRAIHSPWQLREVLVDFWHNHFNVSAVGDHAVAAALPDYDRTIRAHALGNFREFLEAVAGSPAMLVYLSNRSSRAGSANENYGRELFELHTLGRAAYLKVLPYVPERNAAYETTETGRALQTVAELLKMDIGLSVACVDIGGWDHHEQMGGRFATLAGQFARGLAAFWNDTARYHDRLTVVVMTEFGRRLRTNKSNGTDHGHGGVMMALGGKVNGGGIYGRWPGLASGRLDNGVDLAVSTDYRAVLAEILAARLNAAALLPRIFPGYVPGRPLGLVRA